MTVAVLAEGAPGEKRVALVPADVARLAKKAAILVERGAGAKAGFADEAYAAGGATLLPRDELLARADLLLAVRAPADAERIPSSAALVSLGGRDAALGRQLAARGVAHLGLERLPRITRAQSMDVLSSQASVAGYAAVLEGARHLDVMLPMMTTAAGTIRPAKMIALGAGVAGLQAIATARRLGAMVFGFDVREAAREQVESLGAKFVFPDVELPKKEAAGGYAADQSADEQARLRRALAPHLAPMQLVVTTAQIPGRPAPLLIDEDTLGTLQPGTVIVDLAAETGGNCALTRRDELVERNGVRILGPTNLPSTVAADSSRLFSGNLRALLEHLVGADGQLKLDANDPITGPLLGAPAAQPAGVR